MLPRKTFVEALPTMQGFPSFVVGVAAMLFPAIQYLKVKHLAPVRICCDILFFELI